MKQVMQSYKSGALSLEEMPVPAVSKVGVLMRSSRSAVSPGTEKMIIDLAKKSMLGKAAARPDLVRQVIHKARTEGLRSTFQKVQSKLEIPIPLGYSVAGTVVETGAFVDDIQVGDRVACGGAGYANHAEFNHVPRNLCAKIPDGVSDEEACFTTIGSIALQGVRQADLRLGERVVVIGLGLIGQITAQLVRASGCRVLGSDVDPKRLELAKQLGADEVTGAQDLVPMAERFTGGAGADAVIITAADKSSRLVQVAAEIARMKAKVIVVGLVGMDIPRDPYYKKELDVRLSMSYGPGRYDPLYEEAGIDYPLAHVRWTEGRNLEAFLALIAQRKVTLEPLITHRVELDDIVSLYEQMLAGGDYLGVVVRYPEGPPEKPKRERIVLRAEKSEQVRLALIGAGGFAKGVLLPILAKKRGVELATVCTQTGTSCLSTARQFSFGACTTDVQSILDDERINAVMIATRHDLHAELVVRALDAGKHVYTEKPLCIYPEELDKVTEAVRREDGAGKHLVAMAGFNRRYSPHAARLREFFRARSNPLLLTYRVNAGFIPPDHWIQNPKIGGGRIIGEVCHFVDMMRFVVDSPIVQVFAKAIQPATDTIKSTDNVVATLRFADGSVGDILYTALGDSALPKERMEVHGDRKSAVLEDYRDLVLYADGRATKEISGTQDKGHRAEMDTFVGAVLGMVSVDFGAIAEVTRATFAIVDSLRTGAPVDL